MRYLKQLMGVNSGDRRPNKKIKDSLQTENIAAVKKYHLNWKQHEIKCKIAATNIGLLT
jgi:ribosomal protein L11